MASQAEQRDVTSDVREIEAQEKPEVKRQKRPPARLGDYVCTNDEKERALGQFNRKEKALKYQIEIINDISENPSRKELKEIMTKLEQKLADLEEANKRVEVCLDGQELCEHLHRLEEITNTANLCLKNNSSKVASIVGEESAYSRSTNSSKSSEASKRVRLAKLKLEQAHKEAARRAVEEKEEFLRKEEERQTLEKRRIRELEYEAQKLTLEAQLERELELKDPECLENRLKDFDNEPEDVPFVIEPDKQPVTCPQAIQPPTPTHSRGSWVQQFCEGVNEPTSAEDTAATLLFTKSLPRLELPRFSGDPLEWPHFIAMFKSLVHDQKFNDTQKMTYLQRALSGNAKRAIGGMLNHGHLYKAALQELEEQFGNEELVVAAFLSTLFGHPDIGEDFFQLRSYHNSLHMAVSTLQSMGYVHDLAATDNLRRAVSKLPNQLKEKWGEERLKLHPRFPTLVDLDVWLRDRLRAKASVFNILQDRLQQTPRRDRRRNNQNASMKTNAVGKFSTLTTTANNSSSALATTLATVISNDESSKKGPALSALCQVCDQQHSIESCKRFKEMNVNERAQLAKERKLCFCCLKSTTHLAKGCDQKAKCKKENCGKLHHPLIHGADRVFVGAASLQPPKSTVLLQIVPLVIRPLAKGKPVKTFALLDSGSQATLVLESFAKQIGLKGEDSVLHIGTINPKDTVRSSKKVSFSVRPVEDGGRNDDVKVEEAWTVSKLNLPQQKVNKVMMKTWPHLDGINVPEVDSSNVTVLLGANVIDAVTQHEVRRGKPGQPAAVLTRFGWTLTGAVKSFVAPECLHCMHVHRVPSADDLLLQQVQNFWRTDQFGCKYQDTSPRSLNDKRAIERLEKTVIHNSERYEAGLLWNEDQVQMPANRWMAEKRLKSTERILLRDKQLAQKYCETIEGYIAKGYARKLTPEEETKPEEKQWFLPHHPVTNPNKPGKVRIVMDAAAKCDNVSLNSKLLIGPDLLNNLVGVLLRFRQERVAIGADIEAMFHQCAVIKEDQPALRFLWRNLKCEQPPEVYQMLVMIFGAASSPCTANYILRKTADDNRQDPMFSPEAIKAVKENFYMDDLLKSVKDDATAIRLQKELTTLLSKGGFRLTKWSSSSRNVLAEIPDKEKASPSIDLDFDDLPIERSLGLKWNTETDCFRFSVSLRSTAASKRGVLSQVSSVFDPLGVLAPFTLPAKCLIQSLWHKKKGWDDTLDHEERAIWENWLSDLNKLRDFEIPRCLCDETCPLSKVQLHVFGDASEKAFGAVCYARYVLPNGKIHVSFVMAKSRVAPLRQLSIPRLELQAATLCVRLADAVKRELTIDISDTVFWSDSKTVLLYIANESRRFHTFVANRVSEIQDSSSVAQWRHVPGRLNPADDCTRGLRASEFNSSCRWLAGPEFLKLSEESWPKSISAELATDDAEVKKQTWTGFIQSVKESLPDPAKFSSWTRYRRVIAWVYRFITNAKLAKEQRVVTPLTAEELHKAEKIAVKQAQIESFPQDYGALSETKPLPQKSQLLSLCPYLDDEGLLRVGGRLRKAPLLEDARHPLILDPGHDVTRMIMNHCHSKLYCAGPGHVLSELRQRYWILRGLRAVRRISSSCRSCRQRRVQPQPPVMADLPKARLGYQLPPFTNTGVDYFGPLYVRCRRSTVKRYGVLFTCLTVRAVHIEIAHSLETDAVIMALRRMMARRGKPAHIWSDNGTNFVGAERELRDAMGEWEQNRIENKLSQDKVQWHFNPPASPHFGGAWERLVRSTKRALKAIAGEQCVNDETLLTFVAEAEAILNSRPLTSVSSDCRDDEPLTPNHFLLGRASANVPLCVTADNVTSCSRKQWKHAQLMADHFWKRWLREYVPTLSRRSKWSTSTRNMAEGDLVLVVESNTPRGRWPLGRIEKVLPGDDGVVRTAQVRTKSGTYTRPIVKLCRLEGDEQV